jgi:hypothetical protein
MMMALGLFIFELRTVPYQDFQRQTDWRHAANARVGLRPVRQYIGQGDDSVTLTGSLKPELTGGSVTLDVLRVMADTGRAWLLMEGTGRIYGMFVIESLSESKKDFFADGAARSIDFTLNLKRIDDSRIDLLGDVVAIARDTL